VAEKDKEILEEAQARFELCVDAEKDVRRLALDDLQFRANIDQAQWPATLRDERNAQSKPCLTINVLPARERQILNDQRQNRPAIKVSPVDDTGDEKTAEVLQGVVRHIEYDSNSDVAVDTAFSSAARIGFGYMRVITDFEYPDSFDQCIKIKRIPNPFSVYMDPNCFEPDYSDAEFGFIVTDYTKDEYKREFPGSQLADMDKWTTIGNTQPGWIQDEGARVAEYFYKERKKDKLLQVQNAAGETRSIFASELSGEMPKGVRVLNERETERESIKWLKINGVEVLERTEWPGRWIPIIPVLGDELDVDGKKVLEGIVRHTKDPIRMQNYMASAEVEAIALAPKSPWLVAAGQTEDFPEWKTANSKNHHVLRYTVKDINGTLVPPPARIVQEPAIAAITEARMHFVDDLKAVTGIYDAQLGARSNEQTGKAILARQQQGQISNFHYVDNLTRAIRHLGRIVIDLIPKIYNKPRVMRIIGEDGKQETVQVNQRFNENGVDKLYDLTTGRYDVTVTSGPSYQTMRQQSAESMIQVSQAFPELWKVAGDIMAGFFDWPGHEKLAERLKKTLPPELVDDQDGDPEAQLVKAQAQIKQLMQQHQVLTQVVEQQTEMIKTKQVEQQGKVEQTKIQEQSRQFIEQLKIEAQITIAEINTKAQMSRDREQFTNDVWNKTHDSAHQFAMQKDQQGHDQGMAAQQADQANLQQATQIAADQQGAREPSTRPITLPQRSGS
jgi:hypothetical protein